MAKQVKVLKKDNYYTPSRYIRPLFRFISSDKTIYDPSAGAGLLINVFKEAGYDTMQSDIITGQDFLKSDFRIRNSNSVIVTNPPYSLKTEFLEKCIEIGEPFALLMPSSAIETEDRFKMISENDISIISFGERINFIQPDGKIDNNISFETYWYCYRLPIPKQIYYIELEKLSNKQIEIESRLDFARHRNPDFDYRGTFDESLFAGAV